MRKTLLISDDFPPRIGGVATYYQQLCRHLPPERIAVLTSPALQDLSGMTRSAGYRVFRESLLGRGMLAWPRWLPALRALRKLQTRERFGLWWVGQVLPYGTVAWLLAQKMDTPYVISTHGMDVRIPRGRRRILCGKILRGAAAVIANSLSTRGYLSTYGVLPSNVHVVTPGVEPPLAPPPTVVRALTETHDLGGKRVLLTVGRLVSRKNHQIVITVLPALLRRIPNVHYVIAGDGPNRAELQRQARRLGVSDRVVFTGVVSAPELAALYDFAEIFVLTPTVDADGDVEGFGTVFLEAGSHGKPVIASNVPGVNEAVADGVSGVLVPPGNPGRLLEAVAGLLENPALAHRLGIQGQDRALTQFRWESRAQLLQKIFS